jgi:hypothetical protein
MLAEYEVESTLLEHELKEWIARLIEAGLVNIEASGAKAA